MVQLELELPTTSEVRQFVYTIGIVRGTKQSIWFVKNDTENKNQKILQFLMQFPDTIPVQHDHKFFYK